MKTLSSKLTFGYAVVVTLTVAAVVLLGRLYLEELLVHGIDLLNDTEYQEISEILEAQGKMAPEEQLRAALEKHTEIDASLYFFQLLNEQGEVIFKSANLGSHYLPEESSSVEPVTVSSDDLGQLRVSEYDLLGLKLQVASSLQSEVELFRHYEQIGYTAILLVFPLSLALGYGLSRMALNPVRRLQEVAQRITASSLNQRIPVSDSGDEIARLGEFLNEMFDRLEGSFIQVRRFTAEASHELKTPISLVRLQAERLLQQGSLTEEERKSALTEMLAEIDRLNRIIADLLILAKSDSGALGLELKNCEVASFLKDFSDDATLLCEEAGLSFSIDLQGDTTLRLDTRWMRQVLLNLLSNAIKASPPGSTVTMTFKSEEQEHYIYFEDEGSGLPEDKLEDVFNRFVRVASDSDEQGTGLGLSICKSIVEQHGGAIHARNREPRGLVICITLPDIES